MKFTNTNNAGTGTGIAIPDTTRITKDKIDFAGTNGEVDTDKPYLDKDKLKVGNSTLNNGGLTVKKR